MSPARRRSDSCASCKGQYGEDLSGGFYEAGGSSLKYPSIISGFSAVVLAWGGIEWADAYKRSGSLGDLQWKVKWAADHVIAAHPRVSGHLLLSLATGGSSEDASLQL